MLPIPSYPHQAQFAFVGKSAESLVQQPGYKSEAILLLRDDWHGGDEGGVWGEGSQLSSRLSDRDSQ